MAEGQLITSLQLVTFRDVLENVVQEAHSGLQQLADRLPALGDEERKRQLLQHLQATRQRLQRLHVCAQWAHKAKAVNTCREVLKAAADHGAAFVHAADEFFRLNEELRFTRAPLFDVSTALHIMQTGTYRLLPSIIEEELQQPGQRLERPGEQDAAQQGERRAAALRRVDFLLRSKLLASELPVGMRVLRVRGGAATVAAAGGQYTARLTLVPSPRDDVIATKYRPPGEAEEAAAATEEPEVMQPAPGGDAAGAAAAADDQPSTSAAAAGRAATEADSTGGMAAGQQRQGTDCWRWQLLSFELLPAAAGQDPPPLLPQQRQWLQQHIEQRMWAAGDVEQLVRLGKHAWVTVPAPLANPSAKEQQAGRGSSAPLASGPAPSGSLLAPSQLTAAAAADSKGKQQVKEEPGLEQPLPSEQQQQQPENPSHGLPKFATSPLAAMHAILCQTAGRLALFSLLLADSKQLEGGSWGGSLKLSRAPAGSGIRLAYWQQLPCPSYGELLCLREGSPYQPALAAGAAASAGEQQAAPLVEVSLHEDGSLAASSSPQLHHPQTGEAVHLALPLDAASSFDADRLLLQAAAFSAAVQLAAVQAVLQRSGRLAPAGIHAELLVTASSAAAAAGDALPTSPLLQLWAGGSLQLTLSLQLRSGRLLLAAGPALLESEQGSSSAAAVAAAQQQLDQLQRDAMTQPLPAGSSRGMLGANLAADAVARLSLQLSMQQRMDAAAAAAATCGLRRAALPPRLLQQHLQQALLLEPLSSNTLTLALPAFPPPGDLQRWARQRQSAGSGGWGASTVDSGATRCFMLLDFPESPAAAPGSTAQQQEQQQQHPRILLAVCSCTSRGTITRVLQLAELPAEVLQREQQAAATAGGAASSAAASRKRRASDAAAGDAAPAAAAAAGAGSLEASLGAAAAWCQRQGSWAALRAQLALLSVQHAEELCLGPAQQRVIRQPKVPLMAQLEPWAAAQLAAVATSAAEAQPAPKPVATMQLEEEGPAAGAGGSWRVDLTSLYFGHLQRLLEAQGIRLAPPGADAEHMAMQATGLTLRYSLQKGHSMLTAISDLVRLGMLHLCLTRLAGKMAANPLAAGARAAAAAADGKGGGSSQAAGHTNGEISTANGQLPQNGSAASAAALVWPLPGCGSVHLLEASLTHMLLVVAPPPLPLTSDGQAGREQPQPLRLTVRWGNTLLDSSRLAGQAAHQQQQQRQAASSTPGSASASSSKSGSLSHIRCCVSSEPALPEPVAAALEQQLEAGREDLFLDSLCLAAHSAAALARQLLPEAQRAAGLLPGAFQLLGASTGASTSDGPSSALRLRAQLQQGERAATLALGFHACGYTLLQLQPPLRASAAASAAAWMPPLWQRLGQEIPSFAAVDPAAPAAAASNGQQPPEQQNGKQLLQAWVHRDGLAAAVAAVMQAMAAGAQRDS